MRNAVLFITMVLFSFYATTLHAAVWYVDAGKADNNGAGTSWATAKKDLQEAINAAASGDQVWVKKGTYKPTKDVTGSGSPTDPRDKTFLLKDGVKIYGGFGGSETTLIQRNIYGNITTLSGDFNGDDAVTGGGANLAVNNNGEDAYHVVISANSTNTNSLLDGFTIVGGKANGIGSVTLGPSSISRNSGGGMFVNNSDISVANCTFKYNEASQQGGGLQVSNNSQNNITDCIFDRNYSNTNGGGIGIISIISSKRTTITKAKFTYNRADASGGGVSANNSTSGVLNSNFSNNYATNGGGLFSSTGATQGTGVSYSTFYSNNALTNGGAIYQLTGNLSVESTLLYANHCYNYGGAIYIGGSCGIYNSTFFSNWGEIRGGALYYPPSVSGDIFNCIFWKDGGPREIWSDNTGSNKPQIDNSIIEDATGNPLTIPNINVATGNLNSNPLFVNEADPDGPDNILGNGDDGLQLTNCSPAINSGFNGQWVGGTDITGAPRLQLSDVDMGAYEASTNTPNSSALLPTTFTSVTKTQAVATDYVSDCAHNVCTVWQNGSNPIRNTVTAKVWIDNTQNEQFVKRHYEITPADQPSNYVGTVRLYFTQQEFNDFNAVNTLKLPTNALDATGKANLLIEKRGGASSDGSGLPGTYPGATTNINPVDANIVWNSSLSRWEVTFDVAGFSGFFAKTISGALPIVFGDVTASIVNGQLLVRWKIVTENEAAKYIIEVSKDGNTFKPAGEVLTKTTNGQSTDKLEYEFNMATNNIIGLMGVSLAVLLFLPFGMGRRNILLNAIAIIAIFTLAIASCSKKDVPTSKTNENETLYVRIVQVDEAGNSQMSKVVAAKAE